jgi:beta-lactamase superfamily II metal-dependent hydrolase
MIEEGFEVDYMPVGDGKSSGDAIIVKFGDLFSGDRSKFKVVVIDGGTLDSGQSVVDHIQGFTGDNTIDLAIVTHSDNDHASGMQPIIENCQVGALLMHAPWLASENLKFIKSLEKAQEIHEIALANGVTHYDPLSYTSFFDDKLKVLGPSIDYYASLLPQFDGELKMLSASAKQMITETRDPSTETLDDAYKYTSATNNSSTILLFSFGDKQLLFTGDAGVEAMNKAVEAAVAQGYNLRNLYFLHIPHHGSHHNINTDLIDFFSPGTSFISASALAQKHPHPRVVNAFHRRQLPVYATKGLGLRYYHNAPVRRGWSSASLAPFVQQFEA